MVNAHSSRRTPILIAAGIAALLAVGGGVWWAVAGAASRDGAANAPTASEISAAGIPQSALPDSTAMGAVELEVSNLDTMRAYYAGAIGLKVLRETATEVELGYDTPLILLRDSVPGASASSPAEAGLYHSAILYPDEAALARTLVRIAQFAPGSFQGSSDHSVSQAFYFGDPEGNGVELYVDRPREDWVWQNGEVQMGSLALDPNEFVTTHLGNADASDAAGESDSSAATLGHVHLKVGDLSASEDFYSNALGFAVTARSEGALFYSAGGYHHHLATNTWQSPGAGQRGNTTGLGAVTISVGTPAELSEVGSRLDAASVSYEAADGKLLRVEDPWGNVVRVVVAA